MPDIAPWFFISSALFLGWSLGANNAVTLFGTAVASKMVRFRHAALIAGVFVILGAAISGDGTTATITDLGGINAIAGSFTVALSVAIAITWMTRAALPVSTTQAVVGGIIGWNIFTGSPTDLASLSKIVSSWLVSPVIAGAFGFVIFTLIKRTILTWKIHMLALDTWTRVGLIVVGALAAYSLGANNIANVMGMFVQATPFPDRAVSDTLAISGVRQLLVLGGIAIAAGILTYGHKVIKTVGSDLFKISPITGFAVVLAEFLVLFLFTSQSLERVLLDLGLPTIPLVPLAATQSFVGAVIGVGLAKDPQSVDFKVFGRIGLGWLVAPLTAGVLSFVLLYVMQNVFEQRVITPTPYELTPSVLRELDRRGVDIAVIDDLKGERFTSARRFKQAIDTRGRFENRDLVLIYQLAVVDSFRIDSAHARSVLAVDPVGDARAGLRDSTMIETLRKYHGRRFSHRIDFESVVFADSTLWSGTADPLQSIQLDALRKRIVEHMRVPLTHAP